MKPAEFSRIMLKFVEEDKRWRALKVDDIIYDKQPREFEFDYHKMKILEINLEERLILAEDVVGDHVAQLSHFYTEEEFDKL